MNGVIGMLELLNQTPLTKEQVHFISTAQSSAETLLTIINDILDFSKIEAGKLEFEQVEFDLIQVIEDVMELNAKNIADSRIELVNIIPADINRFVIGDPVRLWQLLNNLLGNAQKFTEQGEITIQVSRQEDDRRASLYLFEVSDTGVGITEEAQTLIFEAFTQADGSTTRNYGGTGLGLTICKQLASLFGGEIGCNSIPGKGSTFWFTARLKHATAKNEKTPFMSGLQGLRVLVVDDNETSRLSLYRLLHGWGFHTRLADRGQSALVILNRAVEEKKPFDVVLIDQDMPGLDGLTLARYINENPRLASLKSIVMCTNHKIDISKKRVLAARFDDFITKPLRQKAVYNSIAAVMGYVVAQDEAGLHNGEVVGEFCRVDNRPARILLVEDNLVNQKVAKGMLEKLGCEVDIADNGRIACDKITQGFYNLVLMDCQMPIVDGYAATGMIREYEKSEALKKTPIIAMTANAMSGDKDKCIAAGMDDYISKPVKLKQLQKILGQWLSAKTGEPLVKGDVNEGGGEEKSVQLHIDGRVTDDIVECLGQDSYYEIAMLFVDTAGNLVHALNNAIAKKDNEKLHYLAHTLKGSSGNIGARVLFSLCEQLDREVKADANFDMMVKYVSQISNEFGYVANQLKLAG